MTKEPLAEPRTTDPEPPRSPIRARPWVFWTVVLIIAAIVLALIFWPAAEVPEGDVVPPLSARPVLLP